MRLETNNKSGLQIHQPHLSWMLEVFFAIWHVHSRRIVVIRAGFEPGEETKLKKWVGITWRWMLSTYTFRLLAAYSLCV